MCRVEGEGTCRDHVQGSIGDMLERGLNYVYSAPERAFANFRIHRIFSWLCHIHKEFIELDSCHIPSWVPRSPDSVPMHIFQVFITWLLSSAGGNTTIVWTSATPNLWFPSSQNHSAFLLSAGQLSLPPPTATFPKFSSCPRGLPHSFLAFGFYLSTH